MKKIIVLLLLVCTVSTHAFDHSRRGFMIGVGAGLMSMSFDQTVSGTIFGDLDYSGSESGLATSFKIGGGINEQWMFFYGRDASWFSVADSTYASGVAGFGFHYYLKPETKSLYISGLFGISDLVSVDDNSLSRTGNGYTLGLGYEFAPRISVEGKLMMVNIEEDNYTYDSQTVMLLLNYIWY